MKKALLIYLLSLGPVLFLAGCQSLEVNKASIPIGLGIELDSEKQTITIAAELAKPIAPEQSSAAEEKTMVVTGNGRGVAEASRELALFSPNTPLWSHSNLIILGENICKTDISLVMDYISRNPNIRRNTPLVISVGSTPEEIMQIKPIIDDYVANSISGSLQAQEKQLGIYKPITLIKLLEAIDTSGIEPVIPQVRIIEQGEQKLLQLDGMGVFKKQRMVGSLDELESRGFRLLSSKQVKGGLIIIPSPKESDRYVTVELLDAQIKIKPQVENNQITMNIDIKADGTFYEQGGSVPLLNLETLTLVEQAVNAEISKEISQCIFKAQSLKSDFLGWGELIHKKHPHTWQYMEDSWDNYFPQVQTLIQVDFKIRRTYLTSESFVFN